MHRKARKSLCTIALACLVQVASAADHVDITWMSITNLHLDFGKTRIVADGYITRLPQDLFFGGGGGLARTHRAARPDEAAVREVFDAIGGRAAVNLLITGHSHFDHSFDTPVWARLSGARIIGSPTTCLQARSARIPARRCREVLGGERIALGDGVAMYVVRWNHSGDPAKNPEQHDAVRTAVGSRALREGGLRAGVAEDFPNGGGNRAYLFVIDGPDGPVSLFFQDSASAVDLAVPIVVDGRDYRRTDRQSAARTARCRIERVDLWIGTGGAEVASLVLPVLRPAAYMPVHWDGLFEPFTAGPPASVSPTRARETARRHRCGARQARRSTWTNGGSIAMASVRSIIGRQIRPWAFADGCRHQLKVVGLAYCSRHAQGRNQVTMTSLQHMRRLNTGRVRSSHDNIARTIGKEILTGTWAPGANLPPEASLMQRFGVSRTVLREVMKTLSAKGLIVLKTRVGTRVLNSSSWNFFDAELLAWRVEIGLDEEFRRSLLEIRLAVEPSATGLAAERRSEAHVTQLRDCVRRMAESAGDRDKFAEADLEFHQLIGVASGNPMMRSLAAVIEAALFASFSQNSPVEDPGDLKATAASHGAVVDAIAAGSAARARTAMVGVISLGQARIAARTKSVKSVRPAGRKRTQSARR